MASPNIWPGGLNLAGTVFADGPETLQHDGAVYLSDGIQWLSSTTGSNGNVGNQPELPVATLAQAITNFGVNTNGVIVVGSGHTESLSGSQAMSLANLSIFGCGTGSSRPRFTCTGAVVMFNISGNGTRLENLYFPASTAIPTTRVELGAPYCVVKDCYFEMGASDTSSAIRNPAAGSGNLITGCSFVVTASRPAIGVLISGACTNVTVDDCTFSGGSYGWTDYALKVTAASTGAKVIGGTFTNHSDIGFTVAATSYQILGPEMDGTSNILLTA